jgi:predicted DNA-binding protein
MKLSRDDLSKIQRKLEKRDRQTRTISLDKENYERLLAVCQQRGWVLGRVIDELIDAFLEGIEKDGKR